MQGDIATARQHYETALAIFERLRMPEANQVRQMLAGLEQPPAPTEPPSEAQLILNLTQAAVGAAEGQHAPAEVAQAIGQAGQLASLSPVARAYLAALAGLVGQPQPAAVEALRSPAQAYLETLTGFEAVNLAMTLARLCERRQQPAAAVEFQAVANARLRADDSRESQQTLSVGLYNLAGYLAQLDRFEEAVAALEEVVAIDEQLGLADLESDRATLESYRQRLAGLEPHGQAQERATPPQSPPPGGKQSSLSPGERAGVRATESTPPHAQAHPSNPSTPNDVGARLLAMLKAQLAQAPPEEQAQLRQIVQHVSALSPAEQAALAQDMARRQFEAQADQVVQAAVDAQAAGQVAELLPRLEEAAAHYADGEASGSPYANLAQFVRAVLSLLRGQAPEPVPPEYVERLAELRRRLGG